MMPIKRILVPVDWSDGSLRALKVAVDLAQEHDADLIILHVVPLAVMMYGPAPENYIQHLRDELDRLEAGGRAGRVCRLISDGDPANLILSAAKENQIDLIVMGTHGRSGLSRLLMGSVAEKVVREAPCPVITLSAAACTNPSKSYPAGALSG